MSHMGDLRPPCFRSDIRSLLLAAEVGQKADIMAYSSGHLGLRSLHPRQPKAETAPISWMMAQSREETANTLSLTHRRPKNPVQKKDTNTDGSFLPRINHRTSLSPHHIRILSQKISNRSHDPGKASQCSGPSLTEGDPPPESKPISVQLTSPITSDRKFHVGKNAAEIHEKKLQKQLRKLSAQSRPNGDRLAVFSDVFDDVCEGSTVFGRILREIKTDYDLYVNHLFASQLSRRNTSQNASLADLGKGKTELDKAAEEVYRLEQEAREALEEKKRAQNELKNVGALAEPRDGAVKYVSLWGSQGSSSAGGCNHAMPSKRLEVLDVWQEVQQLEEEAEAAVSHAATAATECRIKDLQTEIIGLIASNHRLKSTNKDMKNTISVLLNREKVSTAARRMLWDEIHRDVETNALSKDK